MKVPEPFLDRYGEFRFNEERIQPDTLRQVTVQGHEMTVIYETPRDDAAHACSIEDVLHILSLVPADDLEGLSLLAFRQPTRNQTMLNPVWGRLFYHADFRVVSGPAIILEALNLPETVRRPKRASVEGRLELERLREDGHRFEETRREFLIHVTPETARNTVLYRTVLHELGHWVDYVQKINNPETALAEDWDEASNLYFARPSREREDFAHRYAAELGARLRAEGSIPFDPR